VGKYLAEITNVREFAFWSPNSITSTSPTQITKVADTNHLNMSSCLRQSPRQTRLCRSNGIWSATSPQVYPPAHSAYNI